MLRVGRVGQLSGGGVIIAGLTIVGILHHGDDLAGARLDRYQCTLNVGLIPSGQPVSHGVVSGLLLGHVQGGGDLQTTA